MKLTLIEYMFMEKILLILITKLDHKKEGKYYIQVKMSQIF
jgi:hypothetical protein